MKVLIDGDIVLYSCCFAGEHTTYKLKHDGNIYTFDGKAELNAWVKDMEPDDYEYESELSVEPLNFVLSTVKNRIANIIEAAKADDYVVYLSGSNNFRESVARIAKYKGNRDSKRKPFHLKDARKYLLKNFKTEVEDTLEADDLLADAQLDAAKAGEKTVIASIDKDLLQVPGLHYNFSNGKKLMVTEGTAKRNLLRQLLTGDRSDNIPGIHRCGPKTADKLLGECETEEEMRQVIFEQWHTYLTGDHCPDWVVDYREEGDPVEDAFQVMTHTGEYEWLTVHDILGELETLLQVGGHKEDEWQNE